MNRFDYMALNSTYLMALENTAPNPYTNTVLQFMAAIPPVWQHAQKCQSSLYHHNNPHTLWAELGFLFHMMQAIERQSRDEVGGVVEEDSTQRVVTPSNFQRTFQCIPEAVALDYLMDPIELFRFECKRLLDSFYRNCILRVVMKVHALGQVVDNPLELP